MSLFRKDTPAVAEYFEEKPQYPAQIPYAPQIVVTDIQYAANSICQLCHLDMATFCEYVWGTQPPTSRHELADRIAAWANENRSDRGTTSR